MKKNIKNKKGNAMLEIVVTLGLISFMLFYPIVNFNVLQKKYLLEDTKNLALQMASTRGGVTQEVLNTIYEDANLKGLKTNDTKGNKLLKVYCYTNKVPSGIEGAMSKDSLVLKTDSNSKIRIKVTYKATNDIKLLKSVNSLIGLGGLIPNAKEYEYSVEGVILSEKVILPSVEKGGH